jgi:subtilisin family serine protease
MDREQLAAVFYGAGRVPPPWATDCPVRFDAWLAFAQYSPDASKRRIDIILAVNEEHGVRRVLDLFQSQKIFGASSPIAAGNFVVARLTLTELVQAILPMTNLFSVVSQAKQAPQADLVAATKGLDTPSPLVDTGDGIERADERKRHLSWLLKLLVAVVQSAETPAVKSRLSTTVLASRQQAAINSVVAMLRGAMTFSSITQPPTVPRKQVIDRRRRYPVVSVTTNRVATPASSRSRQTVKADAAEAVFAVDCSTVGWAVLDSGIDTSHSAFGEWDESPTPMRLGLAPRVMRAFDLVDARRTLFADRTDNGLVDWAKCLPFLEMLVPNQTPVAGLATQATFRQPVDQHGTHVAGVLGGYWPERGLRGICPNIRLYDFRVLDDEGKGDEFAIVMALQAIRHINDQAGRLAIAGVNLSLSVPHDVATHSCGWTPVCIECDRLVRTGVVVVTAAGNAGFTGDIRTAGTDYHTVSISDPGNAESVITVGSTHRSDPHRHGVSYFSSRGPTADGRLKPDILAPGEDIDGPVPGERISAMHGTSQAAAHVSGAAAMLIARYRELLGRPERIKQILCSTATDLGRERSFQGHGLVDVLRAMQSV